MRPIKPLNQEIIAAIAAGEVIQKPVDVVKELIDNALDAQASKIHIYLENSGLDLIQVSDNGHGMSAEDLNLALQPHTTSKIESLTDFAHLQTHGFRGEALYSIAQVAQVSIASRQPDQTHGFQITSLDPTTKPTGIDQGTQVQVSRLFNQAPVRNEFLQRSKTELTRIVSLITEYALANPQVSWKLDHQNRELLNLPSHPDLYARGKAVLGADLTNQLQPVNLNADGFLLNGLFGPAKVWHRRPGQQYLQINQKPVKHPSLNRWLLRFVNKNRVNQLYPTYILNIKLKPERVDFNIHPQKRQVEIFDLEQIQKQLTQILEPILVKSPHSTQKFRYPEIKTLLENSPYQAIADSTDVEDSQHIGQISRTYLCLSNPAGLILLDQHALHERLIFDQLHQQLTQDKLETIPVTQLIELNPTQVSLLETYQALLEKSGFSFSRFGDNTITLQQVPRLLQNSDLNQILIELLHDLQEIDSDQAISELIDQLLAEVACKSAIKAGEYLHQHQRRQLVDQFFQSDHSDTCPHGRPISLQLSLEELNKLFKRTGL